MEQRGREAGLVRAQKRFEAGFVMRSQEPHPGGSHGLVVEVAGAVMRGKAPDPLSNPFHRAIQPPAVKLEPGQAQMVGMPEFGIRQLTRVKSLEEFFITEMRGGDHQGHPSIMEDDGTDCSKVSQACQPGVDGPTLRLRFAAR